jgi:hypothetical protein
MFGYIKEEKYKNVFVFLFLVLIFCFFWWKSYSSIDPDFGYRLRNGLEIPTKGVPKVDPYSYTMPSFPYVEHAWLTAIAMAFVYSSIGYVGLSALASLVFVISILISAHRVKIKNPIVTRYISKYWYFGNTFFILAIANFFDFVGVRAQVISWFMVSVFFYALYDEKLWKKLRVVSPIFFLLWSNLHGSFAAGLSIFLIYLMFRGIRLRKIDKNDLCLFALSVGATIVNPYGTGVWREVWSSVSDSSLRWRISEWLPAFFVSDLSFAAYLTIATTLVWKYRKKYFLEEVVLYFFMLVQALMSARHIPIWIIVSLPIATVGLDHLYSEVKDIKFAVPRFKRVYFFTLIGSVIMFCYSLFFALRSLGSVSEENFYPKGAVEFLKRESFEGNLFSEYGWGGYLIWKYPEKKTFIDGRMPSWRRQSQPEGEASSAFDDYLDIISGKDPYKKQFEKYNVRMVLWPKSEETVLSQIGDKLDNFFERFGKEKDDFNFTKKLENDGWEKIYEDKNSTVYKKSY